MTSLIKMMDPTTLPSSATSTTMVWGFELDEPLGMLAEGRLHWSSGGTPSKHR